MSKSNRVDSGNNEKEEDFLSVDTPIPGQNFTCISFVSPEKELVNKDIYMLHQFLKSKSKDLQISEEELVEQYKDYLYNNKTKLEKYFYEREDFQTTMRGVKVRGTYDTYREAQVRAKLLQRKDKNFHVFVGQVGYWLPWDPNADEIEDQEYSESQLNKLVKKYQENTTKRDTFFEQQKEESLKKIREENSRETGETTNSNKDPLQDMDPWMKQKMEVSESKGNDVTDATEPTGEPKVTETTDDTNNKVFDFDK